MVQLLKLLFAEARHGVAWNGPTWVGELVAVESRAEPGDVVLEERAEVGLAQVLLEEQIQLLRLEFLPKQEQFRPIGERLVGGL